MGSTVGVELAARRLTELLAGPRYRRHWERHSSVRRGQLSRAAVAAVLAGHLFETGEVGWEHRPRSLENRVGRALNGDRLSDRTLELFISAFGMTEEHADELRALLHGRLVPSPLVVAESISGERPMPPRTVRTLQVAEHHEIGADRSPSRHVTRQLLEALEATDRYHYVFDTAHAAVSLSSGGTPVDAFRVEGTPLCAVEILLSEPLLPGQTTHLEFRTDFSYPEPPRPEFRRGVSPGVRHLALTVRFHPTAPPRQVLRARWGDVTATEPDEAVPVELVGGQTALEVVPGGHCVIGYTWRW